VTTLIGMYYEKRKGALIVSDSRVFIGDDNYRKEQKIYEYNKNIIARCGLVCYHDELIDLISQKLKDIKGDQIKKVINNAQIKLFNKYTSENSSTDFELKGIFGFYSDKPELYKFSSKYIEVITPFTVVGNDEGGSNFLKWAFQEDLTKKQAIELATYLIINCAENNSAVDDNPQIAIIEEQGCQILNYDKKNEFRFDIPEILRIKKKMYKINSQYKEMFNKVWKGEEKIKKPLEKLLKN
jgi:20S proteasome alpha/beta subunit